MRWKDRRENNLKFQINGSQQRKLGDDKIIQLSEQDLTHFFITLEFKSTNLVDSSVLLEDNSTFLHFESKMT